MTKIKIAVITLFLLLVAIALTIFFFFNPFRQLAVSTPDAPANNNYEVPAAYPKNTEQFVLQTRELHSDPMNGIGLRYQAKGNNREKLDVNIYPVGALSWVDNPNLLEEEANNILADMDYLIRQQQWQQRLDVLREPLTIHGQQGLCLHFKLQQDKYILYKMVYLFVQQDKYIKFTQDSTDLSPNALLRSRAAVTHMLPLIHAPPESPYAHRVREVHREKMKKRVQELLRDRQSVKP